MAHVRYTATGQTYVAHLDGRLLCQSQTPFLSAARVLIGEGVDPLETLELVRGGMVVMRQTLHRAAALTVVEDASRGPTFAAYREHRLA